MQSKRSSAGGTASVRVEHDQVQVYCYETHVRRDVSLEVGRGKVVLKTTMALSDNAARVGRLTEQ